jgi:hypothetical protein
MLRYATRKSGGVSSMQVGVSVCVLKVSENCKKVELSSEGAVLFHIECVVVLGVGVGWRDVVVGEINGVRVGVREGDL